MAVPKSGTLKLYLIELLAAPSGESPEINAVAEAMKIFNCLLEIENMSLDPPVAKSARIPLSPVAAKQTQPPEIVRTKLVPPSPVSTQQPPSPSPEVERILASLVPPVQPSAPPSAEGMPTGVLDQFMEKIGTKYKQLSHAAIDLNTASDELGKPIQIWEAALKKLNLGVSAWVEISHGRHEEIWWDRGVGYTKLRDRWRIALRERDGNSYAPQEDSEEVWVFNDAPRWMRIEAVGKLPDLLDALLKRAEETTKTIRAKIEQANELAKAISRVADEIAALEEK
jgi:hypothetical protein